MILSALLTCISVLAVLQVKTEDRRAALVFVVPILTHIVTDEYMGGWSYYITACLFDMFVIYFLVTCFSSELAIKLRHAVYVSMVLNLFGFAWWYGLILPYLTSEMTPYFWTYRAFYSWVIFILFRGSKIYVGISEGMRSLACIRRDALSGLGMGCGEDTWRE